MPIEQLTIGTSPPVSLTLVYLGDTRGSSDLVYLHLLSKDETTEERNARRMGPMGQRYMAMRGTWVGRLAASIQASGPVAVVSPPSRRPEEIELYRVAIVSELDATDITARFRKVGNVRSGTGARIENLVGDLDYSVAGDEATYNTLVVVDDVFSSGNSVLALLHHLRHAGLTAGVVVASPFRVIPTLPPKA